MAGLQFMTILVNIVSLGIIVFLPIIALTVVGMLIYGYLRKKRASV